MNLHRDKSSIRIIVLVLLITSCLLVIWQVNYYWGVPLNDRMRHLRAAQRAYATSRKAGLVVGSDEFLCFGIKGGMTVDEVEELLPKSVLRVVGAKVASPPWQGTINIYKFIHGPYDISKGASQKRPFSQETLQVFFDSDGLAKRVELTQWGDVHIMADTHYSFELSNNPASTEYKR